MHHVTSDGVSLVPLQQAMAQMSALTKFSLHDKCESESAGCLAATWLPALTALSGLVSIKLGSSKFQSLGHNLRKLRTDMLTALTLGDFESHLELDELGGPLAHPALCALQMAGAASMEEEWAASFYKHLGTLTGLEHVTLGLLMIVKSRLALRARWRRPFSA